MNVAVEVPYKFRKATEADIPFILALAKELYPDRPVEQGVPWITRAMRDPAHFVVVGPHSAGCCHITKHYGFEPKARLDMLARRPGVTTATMEALKLLRVMLWWAKDRGAKGNFTLDADTGVDFEPFAKRLGGKRVEYVRYEIPL